MGGELLPISRLLENKVHDGVSLPQIKCRLMMLFHCLNWKMVEQK